MPRKVCLTSLPRCRASPTRPPSEPVLAVWLVPAEPGGEYMAKLPVGGVAEDEAFVRGAVHELDAPAQGAVGAVAAEQGAGAVVGDALLGGVVLRVLERGALAAHTRAAEGEVLLVDDAALGFVGLGHRAIFHFHGAAVGGNGGIVENHPPAGDGGGRADTVDGDDAVAHAGVDAGLGHVDGLGGGAGEGGRVGRGRRRGVRGRRGGGGWSGSVGLRLKRPNQKHHQRDYEKNGNGFHPQMYRD